MEPITLATGVIALITSLINFRKASKKEEKPAATGDEPSDITRGNRIFDHVIQAATADPATKNVIDLFLQEPTDTFRRCIARDAVQHMILADPNFAKNLEELYLSTTGTTDEVITVSDSGIITTKGNATQIGNYVAGRDQVFGPAQSDA